VANFLPSHKVAAIHEGLNAGMSLRAIAKFARVSKITVSRYAPRNAERTCRCGASTAHRGWCWWRFAGSPLRQAFVSGWGRGRRPKEYYLSLVAARVIGRFARHWECPKRPRVDWALADALLDEHMAREELALFFDVGETYLRTALERRKRLGLTEHGYGGRRKYVSTRR
jgi:hypothetical protein